MQLIISQGVPGIDVLTDVATLTWNTSGDILFVVGALVFGASLLVRGYGCCLRFGHTLSEAATPRNFETSDTYGYAAATVSALSFVRIRLASGPKIRRVSECLPAKEGCRSKYAPEGYGEKASETYLS